MTEHENGPVGMAIIAAVVGGFISGTVALLAASPFVSTEAEGYVLGVVGIVAGLGCGYWMYRSEIAPAPTPTPTPTPTPIPTPRAAPAAPKISQGLASKWADAKAHAEIHLDAGEHVVAQVFGHLMDFSPEGKKFFVRFGALTLTENRVFFARSVTHRPGEPPVRSSRFQFPAEPDGNPLSYNRQELVTAVAKPGQILLERHGYEWVTFFCINGDRDDFVQAAFEEVLARYERDQAKLAGQERDRASLRPTKPELRLVRDFHEAEEMAAEWVRWMGWPNATRTQASGDGGIDVVGSGSKGKVVAQVKFEALPAGRPVLQALYGAGHGESATHWAFFSSAGYSAQALEWADRVGMALFRFSMDGGIEPVNPSARDLF